MRPAPKVSKTSGTPVNPTEKRMGSPQLAGPFSCRTRHRTCSTLPEKQQRVWKVPIGLGDERSRVRGALIGKVSRRNAPCPRRPPAGTEEERTFADTPLWPAARSPRSATASCTSPSGSPMAPVAPGCAATRPGPGPPRSPKACTGCGPHSVDYRSPRPEPLKDPERSSRATAGAAARRSHEDINQARSCRPTDAVTAPASNAEVRAAGSIARGRGVRPGRGDHVAGTLRVVCAQWERHRTTGRA